MLATNLIVFTIQYRYHAWYWSTQALAFSSTDEKNYYHVGFWQIESHKKWYKYYNIFYYYVYRNNDEHYMYYIAILIIIKCWSYCYVEHYFHYNHDHQSFLLNHENYAIFKAIILVVFTIYKLLI